MNGKENCVEKCLRENQEWHDRCRPGDTFTYYSEETCKEICQNKK